METVLFELQPSWHKALHEELKREYIVSLAAFVEMERRVHTPIYPPKELTFNALINTPIDLVKVVIVGQDPYHGPGQAHGLSFSVPKGVAIPPSLRNIYKELKSDLGLLEPNHGCLIPWARQGVLLLNSTLTVREGKPKSHYGRGWERFTDAILAEIGKKEQPVVFLLWGNSAKEKVERLNLDKRHAILTCAHPSPLSAHHGFLGCRHFSKANEFLVKTESTPIDWQL